MAAGEKITEREFTQLYTAMKELNGKMDSVVEKVNTIEVEIAKMDSKFVTKKEIRWLITAIIAVATVIVTYFAQKPLVP